MNHSLKENPSGSPIRYLDELEVHGNQYLGGRGDELWGRYFRARPRCLV